MLPDEAHTTGRFSFGAIQTDFILTFVLLQAIVEHPKIIFFDFETWEHPEKGLIPNAVVAQYADGTEFRFPKDGQPMTS